MKTVKTLLFTLLVNTLISCGDYLDKPITEELSETELKKSLYELNSEVLIDSTIFEFNNEMGLIREILENKVELKNKFKSLTYEDYSNYKKILNDSFIDSIEKQFIKPTYQKKYGFIIDKMDSVRRVSDKLPFSEKKLIHTVADLWKFNQIMRYKEDELKGIKEFSKLYNGLSYIEYDDYYDIIEDSIMRSKISKYETFKKLNDVYLEVYSKGI
tara:strand:+ start:75 stop:716 length:642 start_codon:yes stop_codon:yes gene_type:complete